MKIRDHSFRTDAKHRVIRWLQQFQLITTRADIAPFVELFKGYPQPPPETEAERHRIMIDLARTVRWVGAEVAGLGYEIDEDDLCEKARFIIRHHAYFNDIRYTQGFDRPVLLLLVIILAAFPEDEAVALATLLSKQFLRIADDPAVVENEGAEFFSRVDGELSRRAPEFSKRLEEEGFSARMFAFRWRWCLFADDHAFHDVLKIWDAIAGSTDRREFVFQLVIAHALQIASVVATRHFDPPLLLHVQQWNSWDVQDLVSMAQMATPRVNCASVR